LHHAAVQRLGSARTFGFVDDLRHAVGRRKIGAVQAQREGVARLKVAGHRTLDLPTTGYEPGAEVVDLHLAATTRCTGTADHQVALGQRVNFTIHAFERRGNEGATTQRFGVADGGHRHVHHLTGLRKSGQLRRDQHGRHVLGLCVDARWQRDAQLLQVVAHHACSHPHHGGQCGLRKRAAGQHPGAGAAHTQHSQPKACWPGWLV